MRRWRRRARSLPSCALIAADWRGDPRRAVASASARDAGVARLRQRCCRRCCGLVVGDRLMAAPGCSTFGLRAAGARAQGHRRRQRRQRERVVVVEVADQWIVVGVAPGSVSALHTMPPRRGTPSAANAAPGDAAGNFGTASDALAGEAQAHARFAGASSAARDVEHRASCVLALPSYRRAARSLRIRAAARRACQRSPAARRRAAAQTLLAAACRRCCCFTALSLPAGAAADDDQLHPHRHRAVAAAPGARHAGRAAEPGDRRPVAVPDASS